MNHRTDMTDPRDKLTAAEGNALRLCTSATLRYLVEHGADPALVAAARTEADERRWQEARGRETMPAPAPEGDET